MRRIIRSLTLSGYAVGMKPPWLLLLIGLAGCAAPGPDFAHAPAARVTVAGSVFDIRVHGRKAQAIRVNRQYAPRLGPIGARAAWAMNAVTGCDVNKLRGDAAVLIGTLRCAGDAPTVPNPARPTGELDCYGIDSFESAATGELITNYTCDWVPDS